jgi:polyisoprenoid-binding protein YceI
MSASAFAMQTKGGLTIAGTTKDIDMRVDALRAKDSVVTATGQETIQMTDFGIKPPTFMLGVLRVGNKLVVKFTLKATAKAVANARAALDKPGSTPTLAP